MSILFFNIVPIVILTVLLNSCFTRIGKQELEIEKIHKTITQLQYDLTTIGKQQNDPSSSSSSSSNSNTFKQSIHEIEEDVLTDEDEKNHDGLKKIKWEEEHKTRNSWKATTKVDLESRGSNHSSIIQSSKSLSSRRQRYLLVDDVIGDGITDDTQAIQRAINRAANNYANAKVVLPKGIFLTTNTLRIKPGITLMGQGYGSSPLAIQFDAGGSVIAYCGTRYAVKINGHASSIESLAIYDWNYDTDTIQCQSLEGKGGVLIHAKNQLVESITMRNVLIYQFMNGTSITLKAQDLGGIAYGSYENLRVRHAKVGIHLIAEEGSFVNSNTFHDGAISGGITDVAVLVQGPGACNDNQFNGMVIEPPSTNIAHVHISGSKSSVRMNDVRLEGTDMEASEKPLVIIEDDSYGNIMNGLLGHTFLKGDLNRNPGITFTTNKMVGLKAAEHNLLWNAPFRGLTDDGSELPGWTTSGASSIMTLVLDQSPPFADHNIIQIAYGGDGVTTFKLTPLDISENPIHSFCTFGIFAQTNVPSSISAAMKSSSGSTIASSSHTGSGNWEFIGMSSLYDKSTGPLPYFSITGDVNVTAPSFIFGQSSSAPGAELMSSSGARMSGLFSTNYLKVSPPDNTMWTIPVEGNIFETLPFEDTGEGSCTTSYNSVYRINDSNPRFPKGSVITILFPSCGNCVPCLAIRDNSYISLLGETDFTPAPGGATSISLASTGTGTWVEISRNGL